MTAASDTVDKMNGLNRRMDSLVPGKMNNFPGEWWENGCENETSNAVHILD
jgi:hypothetical protein